MYPVGPNNESAAPTSACVESHNFILLFVSKADLACAFCVFATFNK